MNARNLASGFRTIDAVVDHYDVAARRPLAGFHVLAVQHVQTSLVPLVRALFTAGVDPADVTVLAKSYSTVPSAVRELTVLGVTVVDPGGMDDPCRSFEEELAERAESAVTGLAGRRLLVLDEGAVAVKALMAVAGSGGLPPAAVRVVEQTTRGGRWADGVDLRFPVVDVARSAAKHEVESPMIAASMWSGLHSALEALGLAGVRRFGLFGYGSIGHRLAGLLRASGGRVAVHDPHAGREAAAREDGHEAAPAERLIVESEVIVGCTGKPVLTTSDLPRVRQGAVLVNAASSDLEFPLWTFRRPENTIGDSTSGDSARPWNNHFTVGRQTLAAGGFPINFWGSGEPIPAEQFQFTRALMLAGAIQCSAESRAGLIGLDHAAQRLVVDVHGGTT